jgi:hypothetical protein
MASKWKNKPICLDLGTLLLDNVTIRFDKELYNEMNKDNKADLIQCEVTRGHKLKCELKKRGIKKVRMILIKYKKWSTIVHIHGSGPNKENTLYTDIMSKKNLAKAVKKEEELKETTQKCVAVDDLTVGLPVEAKVEEPEDEPVEFVDNCRESPCMWLLKKDGMIYFNQMEHEHLPEEDMPPNNI